METGKILKITSILLIALAIPVGVYLVTSPGTTRYRIRAGRAKEALVFLMPSEVRLDRGERAEFSLKIDTGNETVGGVEIGLNFDPDYLSLVGEVKPGSAFPELTSEVSSDRIILRSQDSLVGQGTVATLSFEGISSGGTIIAIDESSVVWDEGRQNNILGKAAGVKVIID